MRWVPFAILAYVVILLQASLAQLLTFELAWAGRVGPDLVATIAVFAALHARNWTDVMLMAWILGLGMDLTSAGGPWGVPVVGPMAVAYALSALLVFRVREAFFRDRLLTAAVFGLLFCLPAHGVWVTWQSLLGAAEMTWGGYARALVQAALLALYTAALTPLVQLALRRCRRWFLPALAGRTTRTGGSARRT
jgi:rod shape-determining protein MreD